MSWCASGPAQYSQTDACLRFAAFSLIIIISLTDGPYQNIHISGTALPRTPPNPKQFESQTS